MEELRVYKSKSGSILYTKEACYEEDAKYDLDYFLRNNITSDKYLDYKKVFFDLIDFDNKKYFDEIAKILNDYYQKIA